MSSPTKPRSPSSFNFVNPFDRHRTSDIAPYQPLLNDPNAPVNAGGPSAPLPGSWRTRAASVFQSFSSNSSNSSEGRCDHKGSVDKLNGPGAIQLKTDLARGRLPSVAAARKPSYVPKYAARAHMASVSGRSTMIGSEQEAEEVLRRGSRMASVSFPQNGAGPSSMMERLSPVVHENAELGVAH